MDDVLNDCIKILEVSLGSVNGKDADKLVRVVRNTLKRLVPRNSDEATEDIDF